MNETHLNFGASYESPTRVRPDLQAWRSMSSFLHDLRHAFRLLHRQPAFAAAALLCLALGMGANTAIFSLLNGVLLRPMPFSDPHRLVFAANSSDRGADGELDGPLSPLETPAEGTPFTAKREGGSTCPGTAPILSLLDEEFMKTWWKDPPFSSPPPPPGADPPDKSS